MPIAALDYSSAKLVMEMNNQIEEAFRIRACAKEPWTVEFIEQIPEGSIFWDIGANTGPYTLIATHRNLITVAIEPGFNSYAALCRNLAMNNMLDRCLSLCVALGEKTCYDWFHYQDMRQGAANHMLGGIRKQFFHKQLVSVWAWDQLIKQLPLPKDRPQYAKMDVDGGELMALKGAAKILSQMPGCLIEMPEEDESEIIKLLENTGLRLATRYDHRDGKPIANIAYGRFERR